MTRVALLFPGQGSQVPGMAAGLLDHPRGQALLEAAAGEGLDLREALAGDSDSLRRTEVAQPALLFVEALLAEPLLELPDLVAMAGHSVGEYAALVAAGVLDAVQAMRLVTLRGRAMAAMRDGGMLALVGAELEVAERVCAEASAAGTLAVANLNAPGQVVLSGSLDALTAATEVARRLGVRRALPLNVSGAFHSPLMAAAGQSFAGVLAGEAFLDARVPVVCNVDAGAERAGPALRQRLARQLVSPVRWSDSVRAIVDDLGAELLIEVGPANVLSGLARRIAPGCEVRSVATLEQAGALVGELAVPAGG
ncbi:MAG: ACP S-malonyltransferase [Candidatus Dormibacteria bacterium]